MRKHALSETQSRELQHRFSTSCDILRQCPHLHHSGTGSLDLARDAVGGGRNDEGPPEVDFPDILESEAGVDAGVGGWGSVVLDFTHLGGILKGQMGEWHHHSHLLGPPG